MSIEEVEAVRTPAELRAEREQVQKVSVWMYRGLWAIAAIVMVFSTINVTPFLVAHAIPEWAAWMVPLAVDAALCINLWGDRVLQRYDVEVRSGAMRWCLFGITWALNVGGSAVPAHGGPDSVGIGVKSIAPVLLVISAHGAERYQRRFAGIVTRLEDAEKAARPGRRTAPQPGPVTAAPQPAPTASQPAPRTPQTAKPAPQSPTKPAPQATTAATPKRPRPEVLAELVEAARAGEQLPTATVLKDREGYSKRWAEDVLAEARKIAAEDPPKPHLVHVAR